MNLRGLHARASAKFCAVTNSFDANVRVTHEDWTVPGNSIDLVIACIVLERLTQRVLRGL